MRGGGSGYPGEGWTEVFCQVVLAQLPSNLAELK